jgi:hypothetical protein
MRMIPQLAVTVTGAMERPAGGVCGLSDFTTARHARTSCEA